VLVSVLIITCTIVLVNIKGGNILPTLHERLQELKISRHLLQKDIAQAAGLSLRAYQYYERGERQPNADTLIALADFYNVSLDYLVGRSDVAERR